MRLHVPGRGLHLDRILLRELLHLQLQAQGRVLWEILQALELPSLVGGQRALGVSREESVLRLTKFIQRCQF